MWQGSVSAMGSQAGLQLLPVQLPPWSTSSRGGCGAAALSGWSLPGPQAVEPASCAASGGTWGSPRPSVDGWQRSTRPASLHRNRIGCSWAQGRAGPIQHLTPVTTCLRRVPVTCFRRSICASRRGPGPRSLVSVLTQCLNQVRAVATVWPEEPWAGPCPCRSHARVHVR